MPRAYINIFARYLILISFVVLCLPWALSAQGSYRTVPAADVDQVINRLSDNYAKLDNFQCLLTKFERLGSKTDLRVYKYSFMKPRIIRMEIIKGKNKGSTAVYKNGSVRARHGGIFKPFVATCKITDRMVTSLRGGTITESDWLSIVDKLKAYRQDNKLKIEGIRERGGRKAYLLAIDGLDEDGITARKLWIDASSFLPVASETYEGKILVNSMDYSDIALDIKMPDGLFDL